MCAREIEARDLVARVRRRLDVLVAPIEAQIRDAGLLGGLTNRARARLLAGLDEPFREVPILVGAQQQDARAIGRIAHDDDTCGESAFGYRNEDTRARSAARALLGTRGCGSGLRLLLHQLIDEARRYLGVVIELHRERVAAAGE